MSASITISRRIEWMDTDAAGIWHHSVAIRFVEAAEAELHRSLGIIDLTFGHTPRARVEFDFHRAVRFDDLVDTTLEVAEVGTTSATYVISMTSGGDPVATGKLVTVLIDDEGRPTPWPARVRDALLGA